MENIIIQFLVVVGPLIFTNNMLMSLVKYLADGSMSRWYLRGVLALLAIVGTISMSATIGEPVDFDSISNLAKILVEALAVGFGAHYTYRAIKEAPSPAR